MGLKALMLAAGVGRRLYGDANNELPKALLEFKGQTLLHRHINILISNGVEELVIVVGHRSEDLIREAEKHAPSGFVKFIFNERYREGPKLSLAKAQNVFKSNSTIIFLDADVLYHSDLMTRLVKSKYQNCFTMDCKFQSSHDFVKVCLYKGKVVDFGKNIKTSCDIVGEWPGILKISGPIASKVAKFSDEFSKNGDESGDYEEVFQAALFASPADTFGVEDISRIPWIEIDYESDLIKANREILPLVDIKVIKK